MRSFCLLAFAGLIGLTGCHSAFIDATVSNRTSEVLSLIEVDYPSASFGTQTLAPGADFHYRFKVLGSGKTSVSWTDAARKEHKDSGPELREIDEGRVGVEIDGEQVVWSVRLINR